MSKIHIGVDIGKDGAIAVSIADGSISTHKMPKIKTELDYHELARLLKDLSKEGIIHVTFEKLGVIFGSSKQTAFSMGEQAGAIEMLCITLGVPYTKVRAVDWQKEMFTGLTEITVPGKTGKPKRDTKAMALVAIKRLCPDLKLTFGDKATKPHDGLIDSVLISLYAKRKNF